MIVQYVKERGYVGQGLDPLYTLGKKYIVLSVGFYEFDRPVSFTILSEDDNTPSLVSSEYFELITNEVPNGWVLTQHGNGFFSLRPHEFTGTFWDDFNEGDSDAEKTFERVYSKLKLSLLEKNKTDV